MWWVLLLVTFGLSFSLVVVVVEGANNCSNGIIPINLTTNVGTISTPNFPNQFNVPYCERWVIDAGPYNEKDPKYIHIYYTQPFFKYMIPPNFTIGFYEEYPFNNNNIYEKSSIKKIKNNKFINADQQILSNRIKRWTSSSIINEKQIQMTTHPHNLRGPLTGDSTLYPKQRYISLEVRIDSLRNTHFRASNSFLHVYGFNLTYEINNSSTLRDNRCSIYRCRAAGNCYAEHDYKSFFCGCKEGRHGQYCEHSSICDPKKNINPCLNGGNCETMASGSAFCTCKPGYIGQICGRRNSTSIRACPGPDCTENCDKQGVVQSSRPCACHNGARSHEGWILYEGEFSVLHQNDTSQLWNLKIELNNLTEEDLKIKKEIELELTERLKKFIPTLQKMDSVSVVSFGPNSNFDFNFFGPPDVFNESQQALSEINVKVYNTTITIDSLRKFHSLPALVLENVSIKPRGTIKELDNYSITCSAIGSSNITFKWFKDDSPIDSSLALWGRITEMLWRENNSFRSTSTLNFDKAYMNDQGTFTCQVTDRDEKQCKDFEMEVLTKPVIIISPMSLTLIKNTSNANITCSAALDSIDRNWGYDWKINGALIRNKHLNEYKEDLFPRGSTLKIVNAEVSKTYTCIVTNNAGEATMDIRVEVIESENSLSCPKQIDKSPSRLSWELTAPNQTAKRLCPPHGYVGFVQRTCELKFGEMKPEWGDPDFSKCVSLKLKSIDRSVQNTKLGFTNLTHLSELTKMMSGYLKSKNFLYLGEGERVISILVDIGLYAIEKGNKSDTKFFELFLKTTTTFLTFQESCFYEKSVISLCNLIYKMSTVYSSLSIFSFQSSALIIESPKMKSNSSSLIFSNEYKTYSKWLDFGMEIPNNEKNESNFILVIFRNLTFPVTSRERINSKKSLQLISPLVHVNSKNYEFFYTQNMILRFKILTSDWTNIILNKHFNVTCGSLDNNPSQSMSWKINACNLITFSNGMIECHCDRFGQFGILIYPVEYVENEKPLALHWSILFGCIICIILCSLALLSILVYSKCRIVTNSIYLLKIIACFSLIISILFALCIRVETPSILLTACLCTFLILSLSCHLTISLRVFITSSRIDPFPWLESVPLLNLLLGISFGCILPLWTSAAAMLHSSYDKSILDEHSPIFGTLVGILVIILILFFVLYFKTIHQLRVNSTMVDTVKIPLLDYRKKTLNRALIITLSTIVTTLSAILHNNSCKDIFYQYLFGFSTFMMGTIIFFSYTIMSEYPIPNLITRYLYGMEHPGFPDPENPSYLASKGIPNNRISEKNYISENNGQVCSILLQNPRRSTSDSRNSSEPETIMETLGGGSSIGSVSKQNRASSSASSIKRPSIGSNKISRSFTDPPNFMNPFPPEHFRRLPQCFEWPIELTNTSGICIGNGPMNLDRPQRGKCLLLDTTSTTSVHLPPSTPMPPIPSMSKIHDTGEYVKPKVGPMSSGGLIISSPSERPMTSKHSMTMFHPNRKHSINLTVNVETETENEIFRPPTTKAYGNFCNPSSHFNDDDSHDEKQEYLVPLMEKKTDDEIRENPNVKHTPPPLLNGIVRKSPPKNGTKLMETIPCDLNHLRRDVR